MKNRCPKRNPGKRKHGVNPAVPGSKFDPQPTILLKLEAPQLFLVATVGGQNPAPPKTPSNDDFPVDTKKPWFQPWFPSGAKWISSIHSMPRSHAELQRRAWSETSRTSQARTTEPRAWRRPASPAIFQRGASEKPPPSCKQRHGG